jgi:hypothetical protein
MHLHAGRGPGPLVLPCLTQREEWPTPCDWLLGTNTKDHPHVFRRSFPGNIPAGVEAFPGAILM